MPKYVTLKDVAERAGTTVATVSYVLNSKKGRYVSQELRSQVLKAADELHYIKCNGASSLKGMDRKLIGILIPQFENQFFTRICSAAEEVFAEHGYDMIICDTFDQPERESAIIHRLLSQRVDGIMITPTRGGTENTKIVRDVGQNMVVVDRPLEGLEDYSWVSVDNYRCGYTAAEHLISKGHRKIIYIGWDSGISVLDERFRGVSDAAAGKASVIHAIAEFSPEDAYRVTGEALAADPDATAVIFGFNIQAKGGVNALRDSGFVPGRDISVVLIGTPEWSYTGCNDYTRIYMGDSEIGRRSARILLDQIQNKAVSAEKSVQECLLIEGTSVIDINRKEER